MDFDQQGLDTKQSTFDYVSHFQPKPSSQFEATIKEWGPIYVVLKSLEQGWEITVLNLLLKPSAEGLREKRIHFIQYTISKERSW